MKKETFKTLVENSDLKKVYLVSRSGEGKTAFIKEYCKENKLSLAILNGSTIEAQDFSGLPYIDENKVMRYAKPYFLESDVLFLDEADRIQDEAVKSALLSLLIDKKISGHDFKGRIIFAGNAEHDSATMEFSTALNERLIRINFEYSPDEKLNYLKTKYNTNENKFLKYCEVSPKIFDSLSTRSIDYYCQISNSSLDVLKEILPVELKNHFEQFLSGLNYTLKDLINADALELQRELSRLKSMTKISLSFDIIASLDFISGLDKEKIKKINYFINDLEAEISGQYFFKLKDLALNNPKFQDLAQKLETLGFFNGQSEFLKELTR